LFKYINKLFQLHEFYAENGIEKERLFCDVERLQIDSRRYIIQIKAKMGKICIFVELLNICCDSGINIKKEEIERRESICKIGKKVKKPSLHIDWADWTLQKFYANISIK
jgi:hypothetical protein